MILVFTRETQSIGRLVGTTSPNHQGRIDLNAWFCPRCGRIFATTHFHLEQSDIARLGYSPTAEYHIVTRGCGDRLFDLTQPHPTFWNCANRDLLDYALMEHFDDTKLSACISTRTDPIQPDLFGGPPADP